ncbi:MAG TPA: hypothetical protein ENI48_05865, partial [Thioploca sp.]|nr:hypothetical protein [Thioploca sp.]
MRFKYLFIIIGIGIVVGVVQYCSPVPPPPPVADNGPWIMPGDVKNTTKATQVDYNDFAYQSFIALNWPAKQGEGSNRGEPDTTKKLGAQGPVVWMTYKRPSEVFLENAKTPNGWNAPPPPPPSNCPPEAAKATIFYRAAKASD